MSQTREEKDLGVIVDDRFLFRPHIIAAANRANQMMGVALHIFDDHSADTIVPIYIVHVRRHQEYGNLLCGTQGTRRILLQLSRYRGELLKEYQS